MKLYINSHSDPAFNLAAEEYLLEHADDDIFMLWRNQPAVIIGKNQNAFTEVDLEFTRERGIRVIRRLTGGGAVFHDLGNINFTFISPDGGSLASRIREGGLDFALFTEPVLEALRKLGIRAELSGRNDLVAEADGEFRKISGNAQCVYSRRDGKSATMHHGTLLFSADLSYMQGALRPDPEKLQSKGIRSVRSRVANIRDLLPDGVRDELADPEVFLAYLAGMMASKLKSAPMPLPDEEAIAALAAEKYSSDDWNLGRMGHFTLTRRRRFAYGTVELSVSVREGRIAEAAVRGDFFGTADIAGLEGALIGCVWSPDSIAQTIAPIPVGQFIAGAENEDLLELLFDKKQK